MYYFHDSFFHSILYPLKFGFHFPSLMKTSLQIAINSQVAKSHRPCDALIILDFSAFYTIDKVISLKLSSFLIFKTLFSPVLLFPHQLLLRFVYGHPSPACPLNPHAALSSILGPGRTVSFSHHTNTADSPICVSNGDLSIPFTGLIYLGV